MVTMGNLYYSFGLIIILYSLSNILKFKQINSLKEWVFKFKKVTGSEPIDKDFRSKEELSLYRGLSVLSFIDFIWSIFGLLTNSWVIFLGILTLSFILRRITNSIKFSLIDKIITYIFYLAKFLLYLLLVINHFHLHYNILDLIKK